MDPRLRSAIDASVGWYDDICATHDVGTVLRDGLWSSLAPPPPLHSDAIVVEPGVTVDQILRRLADRPHAGVKDSFANVDMAGAGMDLLFSATWIHRAPAAGPPVVPSDWSAVSDAGELADWTARHDTTGVLLPSLLERARFKILVKTADEVIVTGAVARLGSGVVDVSNVWVGPGHSVNWVELAAVVHAHFPGRPLVGYERGDDLSAAIEGGFVPIGEQRVWIR